MLVLDVQADVFSNPYEKPQLPMNPSPDKSGASEPNIV